MQCIYQDKHPCNMCAGLLVKVNLQCNQSKCNNVSLSLLPSVHLVLVGSGVYFKNTGGGGGGGRQTEHAQMRGACKLGRGLRWQGNLEIRIHLLDFWAFCADLVTFPLPPIFLSTLLMTPTATVCLISLTAKRPGKTQKHTFLFKWKLLYKDLVFFLVCLWPDLRLKLNHSHLSEVCLTKTRFSLWTGFNGAFRGENENKMQ